MIGAVSNEAHVIKVKKYEMHPEYKNNAESTDYALHNLAIITIACEYKTFLIKLKKLHSLFFFNFFRLIFRQYLFEKMLFLYLKKIYI